MKRYTILVLLAVTLTMTPLGFVTATAPTPQATPPLDFTYQGTPFGGMIDQVIVCTCTMNYLLKIRDAASKSLKSILYTPGKSMLFAHYMIGERRWILGTYSPSPPCEVLKGDKCVPELTDGEINRAPGAGVSKLPTGAAF